MMRVGDRPHPVHPRPLGQRRSPAAASTADVEIVVDDHVIVVVVARHLCRRHVEAPPDRRVAVLAAAAQPLLEHRERRRQHEDRHEGEAALAHLLRALHVDHQHHVAARRQQPLGVRRARAVEVAEDVGPLEELARRDHRLEALAR